MSGVERVIVDIEQMITDYVGAMGTSTRVAASYYDYPAFIAGPQAFVILDDAMEMSDAFEAILQPLRSRGYSHSTCEVQSVKMLNPAMALCGSITSRWADITLLQRSGVTYLVRRGDDGWKIRQLMNTDIDLLNNS